MQFALCSGCLFSFGTVSPDTALLIKGHVDGWGKPLRRETRSCWVPSATKGGVVPRGELDKCTPTTMQHWFPKEGQMVYVNSLECICSSSNLCNGKIMSRNNSSRIKLFNYILIITTTASLYFPPRLVQ